MHCMTLNFKIEFQRQNYFSFFSRFCFKRFRCRQFSSSRCRYAHIKITRSCHFAFHLNTWKHFTERITIVKRFRTFRTSFRYFPVFDVATCRSALVAPSCKYICSTDRVTMTILRFVGDKCFLSSSFSVSFFFSLLNFKMILWRQWRKWCRSTLVRVSHTNENGTHKSFCFLWFDFVCSKCANAKQDVNIYLWPLCAKMQTANGIAKIEISLQPVK